MQQVGQFDTGRPGRLRVWHLAARSLAAVLLVVLAALLALPSQAQTPSNDATLSALTVNDGTNDLTLVPAFAPGTYVYAANVGNAVTSVTLSATVNDDGAVVSGVTLGGTAIADTDFSDGITVPSLIVGDNEIVVTVTAEDPTTQTYMITVTRATANTAPTFDDGTSTSREFNETVGEATVTMASEIETPVAATDTDTLEYSLSGTDAAKFTVDTSNGQIKTVVGQTYDHEAKASYAVTVTVEDGNGGSDTIDVTLNVTDQDEPPLRPEAPTVMGPASNSTTSLRVTMTAPDNSGRPSITHYKLRTHRDGFGWSNLPYNSSSAQNITGITSGKRYHVQFRVKNDEGEGPWSPTTFGYTKAHASGMPDISGAAGVGRTLTAGTSGIRDGNGNSKAENGDVGFAYTYQWVRSVSGTDTDISGATSSTYTLTAADEGNTVKVKASFTDNVGYAEGPLTSNAYPSTGTVLEQIETVTISADTTSAVLKGDDITYTLTRTDGLTTAALPVTVALTQTGDFLAASELTKTVTIAAGQSTQTFTFAATSFQDFAPGATVEGGTLTAAVQAGTGYVPGTPALVDVAIVVALTFGFEMASYSIAEEDGPLAVKLVARTGAGALAPDADAIIAFFTAELDPREARIVQDYESISETVTFAPSDFSVDGSVFKAEQTVDVTIVDDAIDEQSEGFAVFVELTPGLSRKYVNFVDTNGAACQHARCPALVTIIDTDPASADITGIEITSRPANGVSYLEGEAIAVAVTYDQAVAVNTTSGTPTLDLEIDVAQAASYTSISSDNMVLTFSYTIAGDDQDQNGIAIPAGSIGLNGGAITRQGTSDAAHLAYLRLGSDVTQKVNTDPRVISGGVAITSSPTAKTDTYGASETIRFTVTFDSPVAVNTTSGTPHLQFSLANTGAAANSELDYVSGSGTAALTFEYVVQSGDTDTNGIFVRNKWLDANGGTITHSTTGRNARLNHGRPGNNGNFPGHKVDGSLGPSVPNDWALKPSGLGGGDQFRLIFLTSLGRVGSDTDIEDYNNFVRDTAAASSSHAAIKAYSAAFNAVGCTASTDARDNTHTTYTSSNKGVPIYWLNGTKVADEYEDFYDGSWDDEANDKNQLGFNGLDTSNAANYPWTGCNDDGTERTVSGISVALGASAVTVGRPNSTDTDNGPIGSATTRSKTQHRPMYGLSAVFTVMTDTAAPGAPTGLTATADGPGDIDLSWTAPSSIGGAAIEGYKIEFSSNGGVTWYDLVADTDATNTTHSHSSNLSAGNTRHYRVSAINSGGAGPASNVAVATTAAADVLVSNTGQNGDLAATQAIGDQDKTHSQGFETGSALAGYSLASVGVYVSDADLAAGETFTVHIYTADGSGGLDALAYTLTSPNTYKNNAVNKFTAPDGAMLAAGTAYHVVFQATGNAASDVVLGVTSSNEQDTGSELLWTIEDARRFEGSPSSAGTNYQVSVNGTAKTILVPGDWSLKPTELTAGDEFRLIFISSTKRNAVPIDIADYNTFIQGRAAAGHTDIQAYSAGFSVVGCTADTDARDNTGTTGTGVPIYWLNGDPDNAKVADDYADFYDGDWDEERQNRNRDEFGAHGPSTSTTTNHPFTGCKHNGTERFSGGDSFALGAQSVIVGRPNVSASINGPIGSNTPATRTSLRPFYGLSPVFQVASSALPEVPTRLMATAVGTTQIDLYWVTPASNNGLAVTGYRIEVSSNGGVTYTDLVSNTNSDATAYSHTGLSAGAIRTYRVSAINPIGLGPPSGTAFAITAPAGVMGLMVEPGNMQLVVNWTAVDNATGYKVQWKSGVQDYNTGDRQAVIPSGSTTTYTIPNLANGTEYTVQVIATKTGANDGLPSMGVQETPGVTELSLAPTNPTVNETDGTAVFTVTLSLASSGTVTVDYATSDITANAGMDYTATLGTLTFMPGETSKTITITILDDTVYETLERFKVTLSNPAGAALSTASFANVNIANDDLVPTVSMADVIVNEDAVTMTLTMTLSHKSSLPVTYETSGMDVSGTATSPNDYLDFLPGARITITVPAGDLFATFPITIVDDFVDESDETIIITWRQEAGIEATPSSIVFTGTITDNEGSGVSVSPPTLTVAEEDTTERSYTVVLNSQPTADVTVTVEGHAGTVVTPNPTSLNFTPMNWQTAQEVMVTAGNDANTANETVTLNHSAASSDTSYDGILIAGVTVTVNDNDVDQVMGVTITPGDAQLVVNWTAVDHATGYKVQWKSGGQDYNTDDRQAVIPSVSTTTHTIPNLTNGTEYTVQVIATRTGANDGLPSDDVIGTPVTSEIATVSFGASSYSVTEGSSVEVKVKLDVDPERTLTIPITRTDRDGATAADYSGVPENIEFASGETEKTFIFTAALDGYVDEGESVQLGFGALPTGVTAGIPSEAVVNLTDDAPAPVPTPAPVPDARILRIEPSISDVHLSQGDSVGLHIMVYGRQGNRDDSLVDRVGIDVDWYPETAGGQSDSETGNFREVVSEGSDREANGLPDDGNVVYIAPDRPGRYRVTATLDQGAECLPGREGETDIDATKRCTAVFGVVVLRSRFTETPALEPRNPEGVIPTILTDSDGDQYAVFTPEGGGSFIGDTSSLNAGPGVVPNGEVVGLRTSRGSSASNEGKNYRRYTVGGSWYEVSAVDAFGAQISSFELNDPAEVCIPLPNALRSKISDLALVAINGDDSFTVLASQVKIGPNGTNVCGRLSSVPATIAVGSLGAPSSVLAEMFGAEDGSQLPGTGGAAPSSNDGLIWTLPIGLIIAAFGFGAIWIRSRGNVRRTCVRKYT